MIDLIMFIFKNPEQICGDLGDDFHLARIHSMLSAEMVFVYFAHKSARSAGVRQRVWGRSLRAPVQIRTINLLLCATQLPALFLGMTCPF